jgi:hypothetical protein
VVPSKQPKTRKKRRDSYKETNIQKKPTVVKEGLIVAKYHKGTGKPYTEKQLAYFNRHRLARMEEASKKYFQKSNLQSPTKSILKKGGSKEKLRQAVTVETGQISKNLKKKNRVKIVGKTIDISPKKKHQTKVTQFQKTRGCQPRPNDFATPGKEKEAVKEKERKTNQTEIKEINKQIEEEELKKIKYIKDQLKQKDLRNHASYQKIFRVETPLDKAAKSAGLITVEKMTPRNVFMCRRFPNSTEKPNVPLDVKDNTNTQILRLTRKPMSKEARQRLQEQKQLEREKSLLDDLSLIDE